LLRELQLRLGRAFCEQGSEGPGAGAAIGSLRGLPRVSAQDSLGIYQSAVDNALRGALREIFPVCAALVGEDCFAATARDYGLATPSHHPDLARCGEAFPRFLAQLPYLDPVPYLSDVARLELAWHAAFSAPGPPSAANPETIAEEIAEALSQRPESWRFLLPPSAHLVFSPHPVLAIWEAHQQDGEALDDPGSSLEIDLESGPDYLIVWRRDLDLRIERVEAGLWPLLEAIEHGKRVETILTLGEPADASSGGELGELAAADFAPLLESLRELFSRGWIAGAAHVGETSEPG
jgi:hypothetical protein